jgi:transposase
VLQAAILLDKFYIIRQLEEALDKVPGSEYARPRGKARRYIEREKHTLLSHREKPAQEDRLTLKTLLAANRRLNSAYPRKESFGQLRDCEREGWVRRLFENWSASLIWQRLEPYEKFAQMIDRHRDGIAA